MEPRVSLVGPDFLEPRDLRGLRGLRGRKERKACLADTTRASRANLATAEETDHRDNLEEKDRLDRKVLLDRLAHLVRPDFQVCPGPKVTWELDMREPKARSEIKAPRGRKVRREPGSRRPDRPLPRSDLRVRPDSGGPKGTPE